MKINMGAPEKKIKSRTAELAQLLKVLPAKANNLSLIPEQKERTKPRRSSSDFTHL